MEPYPPITWDPKVNEAAYAEVEAASNYPDVAALEAYRSLLLRKSADAVDAIRKLAPAGRRLDVLELCAGSGRLLYALDAAGMLGSGTGVEVSASRHRFAQEWGLALGATRVRNVNMSAGAFAWPDRPLDLAIAIDGALSYLYPCDVALPRRIAAEAARVLVPGGLLLMEFDVLSPTQLDALRRDTRTRTWHKGDDRDAFVYALYETTIVDWAHMVVQNLSIYLPRAGGGAREKRELYKFFSVRELSAIAQALGFEASFHGSFALEPFGEASRSLVCAFKKR